MDNLTRREFIRRSAAIASSAVAAPIFVPASALGRAGRPAASERIVMGCIGVGNQGTALLRGFLADERVQVVAVCDVNEESAGYWSNSVRGSAPARQTVESHYSSGDSADYKGCTVYSDFQELLARDDIDAVTVATPDHWHALITIAAAEAGKDIYCEKPLALTIPEGRAMCQAVRRYGRIFQTGSQQRSDPNFRRVCELVRNGRIGELERVTVGLPGGTPDYGKTGDQTDPQEVPEGFDYDRWLGPAPYTPYCPARTHVNFRWVLDYSGGQLTDWGGHHPDIAQWGMDTEDTGPIEVRGASAEWATHPVWDTATKYRFECVYQNGVTLVVADNGQVRGGVHFEGSEGWAWADRGRHEVFPENLRDTVIGPNEVHLYRSTHHLRNFVDGVITRKDPIAPVETAHRSITIAHLGNIAMRLGLERLRWDPVAEKVIDQPIAQAMVDAVAAHKNAGDLSLEDLKGLREITMTYSDLKDEPVRGPVLNLPGNDDGVLFARNTLTDATLRLLAARTADD